MTPFDWMWWRIAYSRRNRGGTIDMGGGVWYYLAFGLWVCRPRARAAGENAK